jgi:hypothetical protein
VDRSAERLWDGLRSEQCQCLGYQRRRQGRRGPGVGPLQCPGVPLGRDRIGHHDSAPAPG